MRVSMSAKTAFLILGIVTIIGVISSERFAENFSLSLSAAIAFLAFVVWGTIFTKRRKEKSIDLSKTLKIVEQEDNEYHNDFSKVPGGTADPIQPLPRSIGYGYGVGGQTLDEDLERIGIKITENKKNE